MYSYTLRFSYTLAGFSMSRTHKDKYENTNPRRTHTIMSSEDAASGKKSNWPELEITGKEDFHSFFF
jgi:CCR4-NOT transcription complex subunit 6